MIVKATIAEVRQVTVNVPDDATDEVIRSIVILAAFRERQSKFKIVKCVEKPAIVEPIED